MIIVSPARVVPSPSQPGPRVAGACEDLMQNPKCPLCGSDVIWGDPDIYQAHEFRFSERQQICSNIGACEWAGVTALFPWKRNPRMEFADISDVELDAAIANATPVSRG